MRILSIDLETYSETDIAKVGAYKYAENSEILLFGYAFDDEPVRVVDMANGEALPPEVRSAIFDTKILKTAFNAPFERAVLSDYFTTGNYIDGDVVPITVGPDDWFCTMVQAYTLGISGGLDNVSKVLRLSEDKAKMSVGKQLIQYFCKPCKPTKGNGGRTRNRPSDAPEKWSLFKKYCARDVEAEREIRKKIQRFWPTDFERRLWCLDQRINDRGVRIDQTLVSNAINTDVRFKSEIIDEARQISGIENPNSREQVLDWFTEQEGFRPEKFDKETRMELLKDVKSPKVRRLLELKQLLSKTSVKKYEAMQKACCCDGRIHGALQFHGAARTGRWAGRLVQLQNLPKNKMEDLDFARRTLENGDYDLLTMFYDNVPDVLSQLIRTAFVADEGSRFIVADFSAIEARVTAWLAGEKWRMDVFAGDGKIYEASAAQMFKVPVETIDKRSPLRAKGNVAELACIAKGQLVLTKRGLVPIENVKSWDVLWDGLRYVRHEGVVERGTKDVLFYDGLIATADHLVWIEGAAYPVPFGEAATRGAHLLQSGNNKKALRVGRDHQLGKTLGQRMETSACFYKMYKLQNRTIDRFSSAEKRIIKRVSRMLATKKNPAVAGSEVDSGKATLHKSKRQKLSQLWRKRNQIRVQIRIGSGSMDYRKSRSSRTYHEIGSDRQQRQLQTRQHPVYPKKNQSAKQTIDYFTGMAPRGMAVFPECSTQNAKKRFIQSGNFGVCEKSCPRKAKKLAYYIGKVKVYDILNAGPRNRYTVSNCLVHNCGYGGGAGALIAMGALDGGLTENELPVIIEKWRAASPRIVRMWHDVEKCAKRAIREKARVSYAHGVQFSYEAGLMFIRLPSGRRIAYVRPRLEREVKFDRIGITYEGPAQAPKGKGGGKWRRLHTWGGKLVENIVQAIARDCLAVSMMRLDADGYPIIMHVHDEVICEMLNGMGSLDETCEIMGQPIDWAPGLVLRAEGYETKYYRKD